jgi:hypothetical protein
MTREKYIVIVLLAVIFSSTSCQTEYLASRQIVDLIEARTVTPSLTSHPPYTASETTTPHPTYAALPPITKTPGVLYCADIVKAHQESTKVEWEKTKLLLRGSEMYYIGKVNSVTKTDAVHMTGSLCHVTLHHVPHEIAINLSNGQQVEGYGTISNINFSRGEDIDIEVNPDLLFVR